MELTQTRASGSVQANPSATDRARSDGCHSCGALASSGLGKTTGTPSGAPQARERAMDATQPSPTPPHQEPVETVIDPVCGMKVVPGSAKGGSHLHEGTTYWFCNPRCRERFVANPAQYLQKQADQAGEQVRGTGAAHVHGGGHVHAHATGKQAATPGTVWICPMDPEVRSEVPAACPKCGMALEPEVPAGPSTRPSTPARCTRRSCGRAGLLPHLRHGARAAHRRPPRSRRTPSSST